MFALAGRLPEHVSLSRLLTVGSSGFLLSDVRVSIVSIHAYTRLAAVGLAVFPFVTGSATFRKSKGKRSRTRGRKDIGWTKAGEGARKDSVRGTLRK